MQWQGKIDFQRPITLNGKPHGVEQLTSLPTWIAGDEGRVVYSIDTGKLWVGTSIGWDELTPGGIAPHEHDDRYYTENEINGMFEGKNGEKQIINWVNVVNKPSTFTPSEHAHPTYLTQSQIDFSFMQTQGLVGSGINQLAQGNHTHTNFALDNHSHIEYSSIDHEHTEYSLTSHEHIEYSLTNHEHTEYSLTDHEHTEYSLTSHEHDAIDITYDNINSNLVSLNTNDAIDEIMEFTGKTVKSFLYVDKHRTDNYIETGSQARPFKTIAAATAIATNGVGIYLSEGTYSEDIILQEGACLFGAEASKTYLEGTLTTTNKARVYLKGFSLYNTLTITGRASISGVFCKGSVFINGVTDKSEIEALNFTVNGILTIGNNVETVIFTNGGVNTSDGNTCINAASGVVVFNAPIISVKNVATSNPAINITGTATLHVNQGLIQTTGGNAITCTSTPTLPNFISDTQYVGAGMSFGSASTIIEGVYCLSGAVLLSGSAIQLRPSKQISYNNIISGLSSNNVQEAIDELSEIQGVIPQTDDMPLDAPATGTQRFDATTNTLYIYNGATWVSTVLV